jgi:hypothetical protein
LTDLRYTRGILPALAIGYYAPHFLAALSPNLENRLWWEWVWQLFPVWVSVIQWTLAKFAFKSTIMQDRIEGVKRDLPTIRFTIALPMVISMAVWWYTLSFAPVPWAAVFVPKWDVSALSDTVDIVRNIIQWDWVFCYGCAFLCVAYMAWDMKAAKMVKSSWASLVLKTAASIVVMGPGAALGLVWLWREDVLATRRHKGAIVKGEGIKQANGKYGNGGVSWLKN